MSSLNEGKKNTPVRLLQVLCPAQTLKNKSRNVLPFIVVFVGSENRGMSRR